MPALDVEYFDRVGCICIEDIDIVFSVVYQEDVLTDGLNVLHFMTLDPVDERWRGILLVQVLKVPHLLQVGLTHHLVGILC